MNAAVVGSCLRVLERIQLCYSEQSAIFNHYSPILSTSALAIHSSFFLQASLYIGRRERVKRHRCAGAGVTGGGGRIYPVHNRGSRVLAVQTQRQLPLSECNHITCDRYAWPNISTFNTYTHQPCKPQPYQPS